VKVDTEGVADVGDCGCPPELVVTAVAEAAGVPAVVAGADVAVDAGGLRVTPAAAQYEIPNCAAAANMIR
jgi:hypothetical protein